MNEFLGPIFEKQIKSAKNFKSVDYDFCYRCGQSQVKQNKRGRPKSNLENFEVKHQNCSKICSNCQKHFESIESYNSHLQV